MDTLSNLKAFVAAAETGSFSAAARQAGLVPSVISKRIEQLEWRIRAPLFTRSTRKLTLTDVGERYLPVVRALVRQLDDALAGMAQASGELEGHIRIKIPTTLGVLNLSQLLNRFLVERPMISMDVVLADRSVNPLEEGFDIAIGARPESYGQVMDHPLCPIRRRLCAAPGYLQRRGAPQAPAELMDHDCLVFATSGTRWEFQGPQGLVGVDVRPMLKSNDGVALCQAALDGMGVSLLADYLVAPALATGRLVELLPGHRLPDLWLKALVPANRIELPRIHTLVQWLTVQLQSAQLGGPLPADVERFR
ncbi:MAG: LysR family transcriptional regulator [Hydrogenophaga sp.]|uniref:LysR family transcriptional regulator n=1 Tax=Hydrogenophaga sp. TaxID=1904254 RepID=UPI0027274D66|nr:LysR family transcriptional regulator [Hydrogenophaga sp.]MDO9148046.1 LysR family transcriptional regulator [Hydrogenophaga sp.]MDO9603671.1 LysR family transcriptional regulator [Hydrogenophaga sp.]